MPTSTRQIAPFSMKIFGKFAAAQRADVGIGPYSGYAICRTHVPPPKMLIEISEIRGLFLSGMPLQKAVGLCIIQTQNRVCRLCGF